MICKHGTSGLHTITKRIIATERAVDTPRATHSPHRRRRGSLRRRKQWTHIHRATRFPRSRSVRQREQWLATLGATHSPHNRRRQDCSCSKNQPAAERARTHYTTQSELSLTACPPANQFNGHCVEQVLSPHECIMVGRSSKRPQVHW